MMRQQAFVPEYVYMYYLTIELGLCNPGIPGWIPWASLKIPVPYTHPPAKNAPLSFT